MEFHLFLNLTIRVFVFQFNLHRTKMVFAEVHAIAHSTRRYAFVCPSILSARAHFSKKSYPVIGLQVVFILTPLHRMLLKLRLYAAAAQ